MRKSILSALLVSAVVLLSSCGDSATKVNDILVEKSDKVVELMEIAGQYIQTDDYDNALAYLDSVSVFTTEAVPVISALKNKSAEKLQKATVEYMELFNSGVASYKQAIELYQTAEDNDQMDVANNLVNDFIEKTQVKLTEMQEIQAEFAKSNNTL